MDPYIPGIDVPIGCRPREREGRPRRPLIRLVGGIVPDVPSYRPWGENWATLVLISSVDFLAPDGMLSCEHPGPSIFMYHKRHSNPVLCSEMPCLPASGRLGEGVPHLTPGVIGCRKLLSAIVGTTT